MPKDLKDPHTGLTIKQKKLAAALVKYGDANTATLAAGFTGNRESRKESVARINKKPAFQNEVQRQIQLQLVDGADKVGKLLKDLLDEANNPESGMSVANRLKVLEYYTKLSGAEPPKKSQKLVANVNLSKLPGTD